MDDSETGADSIVRSVGDRYTLEECIGEGGMGQVWRARHRALRSVVAIKFLHGGSASSENARQRFLTEARLTASLRSRHAVQVFDYGVTEQGVPYVVMELLEGETLDRYIARHGALRVEDVVYFLRQAARALGRAHDLGIVHRDFKPQNLVVYTSDNPRGEIKVVDFGIAKLVGELEPADDYEAQPPDSAPSSLSRSGQALGTPYYMAPEQILMSPDIGPAADVWALGVVAYECLTGQRPFQADRVTAVFQKILQNDYPPAHHLRGELPETTEAWFEAALAPEPGRRFGSATIAVEALAGALGLPSVSVFPPPLPPSERLANDASTLEPPYDDPSAITTPSKRRISALDWIAILAVLIAFGAAMAVALLGR